MSEINEFHVIWRVLKTIFEMCSDRGYMVSHLFLDETLEEFKEKNNNVVPLKNNLFFKFKHSFNQDDVVCVIFQVETISNQSVRSMMSLMEENSTRKSIVVACDDAKITPGAKKLMEEAAPSYFFDCFYEKELLVNVTQHELVPEHIVLDDSEATEVLETYRAKQSQLPRILKTDPICRYLGTRPGQILKIIRKSETAGIYITYRIVY